ncbi:MAG TPA: TRAM domain-containing protein, partial [Methylomirabilota bacterium]|nr:TRAM domain-containing protein [Methylomirabilota bacterium]
MVIDRLASGGAGVARHEGRALFVPGGLPGDRVRVRLTASRGRRAEGHIVEVLAPSPARVTPPCRYAGVCGGCAWLALDLGAQRRARAD